MDCKTQSTNQRHGFTLVELLIATALSIMILLAVVLFIVYISQGSVAVVNHVVMENKSQLAADNLSKRIRSVRALTNYTSTTLTFLDFDSNTLQVAYSSATGTLSITKTNVTTTYLTNCNNVTFTMLQETISPGVLDATNTTASVTNCRMVLINWICTTNVLGSDTNQESLQCAKIVFRN